MESLGRKNLSLVDWTHEVGIMPELLAAIELTLGNVNSSSIKSYNDLLKQVWARIKNNVTTNTENVLNRNDKDVENPKLIKKVLVTPNQSIIIAGEDIPDKSGDYSRLFATTLKTLLEVANSQLQEASSNLNKKASSPFSSSTHQDLYKLYYDKVTRGGFSFRSSLSHLVEAPEVWMETRSVERVPWSHWAKSLN